MRTDSFDRPGDPHLCSDPHYSHTANQSTIWFQAFRSDDHRLLLVSEPLHWEKVSDLEVYSYAEFPSVEEVIEGAVDQAVQAVDDAVLGWNSKIPREAEASVVLRIHSSTPIDLEY